MCNWVAWWYKPAKGGSPERIVSVMSESAAAMLARPSHRLPKATGPRYDTWRNGIDEGLAAARTEHDGLDREIAAHDDERKRNTDELAAADSARERARQRVLQSEERVAALIGNEHG
jgi:hypothetical protein